MRLLFKILFLLVCTYSFINASIVGATKGEFSVNQGTARYKLELKTPNGVNGLKPKLSINYKSSNNFNGVLGVGFSLGGISQIYKCNQDLFSEKQDTSRNYNYCFNGQKLVLKDNTQNYGTNTEYKTEIDSYSKIVKDSVGWTVYTKAGLKLEFGKNNGSQNTYAKDLDVVYRVNKISDKFENDITFEYDSTQKSVSKIAYSDSVITFDYVDRTDKKTLYKRGTSVELDKRLENIFIKKNGTLVYKYVIDYKENETPSRIEKISECIGNSCLEPIKFKWEKKYSGSVFNKTEYTIQTDYKNLVPGNIGHDYTKNYKYKLGDFNGDGLTDMLHFIDEQHFQVWLSNGDGTFNELANDTFNYNLYFENYKTGDFNGDGMTDIIEIAGYNVVRVWLANGDGTFFNKIIQLNYSNAVYPWGKLDYELGDFNGDGLTDVLHFANTNYAYVWFSNEDGTFTTKKIDYSGRNYYLYGDDGEGSSDMNYTFQSRTGDFNGDGLTDIIFKGSYTGSFLFWYSNGDGTFNTSTIYIKGGLELKDVRIGDFNGDGITDILWGETDYDNDKFFSYVYFLKGDGIYESVKIENENLSEGDYYKIIDFNKDGLYDIVNIKNSRISFHLSKGDGSFSSFVDSVSIISIGPIGVKPFIEVIDFDGDGSIDILYPKSTSTIGLWQNKNKKQSIKNITNTRDENITITYSNLRDSDAYESTLTTDYPNRYIKASAAKVVKSFSSLNGVGNDTNETRFKYYDFKINYERGALGFGKVETKNEILNTITKTMFNQNFPKTGIVDSREIQVNSKKVSYEEYEYNTDYNTTSKSYYQLYLKKKKEYGYDYDNSLTLLSSKITENLIVDQYGNIKDAKVSTHSNTPEGDKNTTQTITKKFEQIDESKWIIANPTKVTNTYTYDGSTKTKVNEYKYYDNGTTKDGSLEYEIIEPSNPKALTKAYDYDIFGNIVSEKLSGAGMDQRTTTYRYDNANINLKDIENIVTKDTGNITLTETRTYNDRDQIKTIKDISGLTTTFEYDSLGRKNKEIRPDTSSTEWTYDWIDGELEVIETVNGNFPYKTYFDRLGREIRKEKIGFDDVTTIEEFFYDAKGNKTLTHMPYFEGAIPKYIKYTYDDLNRLTHTNSPAPHNQRAIEKNKYDGFKTTKINALNQKKVITLNALGKVALVEDNQEGTEDNEKGKIRYKYYADGTLHKTIENSDTENPKNTIEITYDAFGNKTKQVDPDMGTWDYTYNAFGELKTQKDANNKTILFEYDEIGRLTSKDVQGTNELVTFEYDDIATNGKGKIHKEISVDAKSGKVIKQYKYYDDGKLKDNITTIYDSQEEGGMSYPYTKSYSYDDYGRVETITEPNNVVMTNHYKGEYLDSVTTPRKNAGTPNSAKLLQKVSYATSQYLQNKTIVSQYNNQILEYEAKIARYKEIIDIYQNNPTKVNAITQIVVQVNELEELVETLQAVVDNYNEATGNPNLSGLQTALSASDSAEVAAMYQNFQNELVKIAESSLTLLTEIKDKEAENRKLLYCGNIGGILIFCPDPMTEDNPNYSPEDNIIFYGAKDDVLKYYQTALTALENDVNYINGINDKIAYYTNLENAYKNQEGIFSEIANDTGKIYFYKVVQKNALGITTSYVSGNGLVTKKEFDESGTLYGIKTGFETEADIRDLSFTYDKLKNVKSRAESSSTKLAYHYKFEYDELNRVTKVESIANNEANREHLNLNIDYEYDAIGNITYKSDVGYYNYNPARPHAVESIYTIENDKNSEIKNFEYDANGNMIKNAGRKITYSSFNKPIEMEHGMKEVKFYYDANENRYKKYTNSETIHYIDKSYEKIITNSSQQHRYFVYADGKLVSIFTNTDGDYDVTFMHYDNLGSIDTITDYFGEVVQRFIYKPFGERIVLDKNGALVTSDSNTKRGYTGHEHIDEFDFIHMNGRVYDPTIGRFLSADPTIPYIYESQSYNRYSYARNNPLKYVDPSGYLDSDGMDDDDETDGYGNESQDGGFDDDGTDDDGYGDGTGGADSYGGNSSEGDGDGNSESSLWEDSLKAAKDSYYQNLASIFGRDYAVRTYAMNVLSEVSISKNLKGSLKDVKNPKAFITHSINLIKKTKWGKTKRGIAVINRLEGMNKNGSIKIGKLVGANAEYWTGLYTLFESITLNIDLAKKSVPGVLAHEGTHALRFTEYWGSDNLFDNEREAWDNAYAVDIELDPSGAIDLSNEKLREIYEIK